MLEKVKRMPERAREFVKGPADAKPILESLGRSLRHESNNNLKILKCRSRVLHQVTELHLAIDNLTNIDTVVRRTHLSKDLIGVESALVVLDREIVKTTDLIEKRITNSINAGEIAIHTLNLLFTAKQKLKQDFGIETALEINGPERKDDVAKSVQLKSSTATAFPARQMILSPAMMFGLRQSLFPAERMIVGAACRANDTINIDSLFDVTGDASSVGVKADPDRLAQALIAMAETGTYFGLWIHSHPGTGGRATHPSSIDIAQHADWLKDYSPDLVSAIMVKDRYIRFWGTAVESGKVTIAVEGSGITLVSPEEQIYRLSS